MHIPEEMLYLVDHTQFFKFSRMRVVYFGFFLLAFAATEIGRYIYRPFIYQHGINDFWIADTMGNHIGVITQIFFILAMCNSDKVRAVRIMIFITAGYCVYEILQTLLPKGTFDINDIIATLIGGCCAYLLFLAIHKIKLFPVASFP